MSPKELPDLYREIESDYVICAAKGCIDKFRADYNITA